MSGRSILLWLLLALMPASPAIALGLGDIRVDSGLNQPLSAEIELVGATHDDLQRVKISVASRDEFLHYGADRPSFLSSVSFRVIEDGAGHVIVRVRSAETFTEPFVAMLIDVSWPGGKVIRDYTLLLDPPGMNAVPPAQDATANVPVARVARTQDTTSPITAPKTPGMAVKPHTRAIAPEETSVRASAQPLVETQRVTPRTHRAERARTHATAPASAPASTPTSAVDATSLASLAERVRLLETALEQTKQAQAGEHAELLALRAQIADASMNAPTAHVVESPLLTTPVRDALPTPAAEPVVPYSAAVEPAETEVDAVTAETAQQEPLATQSDGSAAPAPGRLSAAMLVIKRIPWRMITLLIAAVAFLYLAMRHLAHRRAMRSTLASFDDAEPAPDELDDSAPARSASEPGGRDTLWMRQPEPPRHELPEPARVALFDDEPAMPTVPEPLEAASVPEDPAEDATSYLTAIERELCVDDLHDGEFLDESITVAARPPYVDDDTEDIAATLDTTGTIPDMLVLEPDFTSTDMELTSRRYDHAPGTTERRSDATDALKDALRFAIEREPDRVDLRIKLLEVYYATAVANHLAFFDLASALARERDHLPAEELERILAMQRAIAAGPSRTAAPASGEDLANCA